MIFASEQTDVRVHLGPEDLAQAFRSDVRAGLTAAFKELPPKWLYDDRGCDLFEEITQLEEYYPTRREHAILLERAPLIAQLSRADTLVELGSGTSAKTRVLIEALLDRGQLRSFVAFDVAESVLRHAAIQLTTDYPTLAVTAVVGDFERHLEVLPREGTRLIAFLGGTVGNLSPSVRRQFLADLVATMQPGDSFLVGTDLVKDRGRLVAAYDDAAGVTAAFNRNVLDVVNRELDADFDPSAFDHIARFDEEHSWIEMRLRSRTAQRVTLGSLDLTVDFAEGEDIRTEISTKFTTTQICHELSTVGLTPLGQWTDAAGDFALTMARRV